MSKNKKPTKRADKYEKKVELKEDVTFDDLMQVALNFDKKKEDAKKKKK